MERRSLQLGDYNTARDGLFTLAELSLETPEFVEAYQTVDGRDGHIDACDAILGRPVFKARRLRAKLETSSGSISERELRISDLIYRCHGRRLEIRHPDFPTKRLYGRIKCRRNFNHPSYSEVEIEGICDPWFRDEATRLLQLPIQVKGENFATFSSIEELTASSTCTDISHIGDSEVVAPTLCTGPNPIHSYGCWRIAVTPGEDFYVSGRLFGSAGFWRVSGGLTVPEAFSPWVTSSSDGWIYIWVHRLAAVDVCNLGDLLVLPAAACRSLNTGGFLDEFAISREDSLHGVFSIAGRSVPFSGCRQSLSDPPFGSVPVVAWCSESVTEPGTARIMWKGLSL